MSATTAASSLIVVSNRLPFVLCRNEDGSLVRKSSAGGLVTAVCPVMVRSGGMWIGWPGLYMEENEQIPESDSDDCSLTAGLKSSQVVAVNIDEEGHDLYYNGCCNATFWPLFHSMPDRTVFNEDFWNAYKKVNENFAQATLKALRKTLDSRPDQVPIVWFHDYHLMLAANTVKLMADEQNLCCKIGFFLHIPFPPWDILKIFPWFDMIIQGILACDLVGFHTRDYCLNFLDCCQRGLGSRIDKGSMLAEHGGRFVRVRELPIGIPFNHFEDLAKRCESKSVAPNCQIILGVDRLDYTKGLPNRLLAFEKLLQSHPKYLEKVILLQIAVPSRKDVKEYLELKEKMDRMVGRINGKFSTPLWSPIRYIYGCVSQAELAGFYKNADVALVTPLRDGMNLVAKEFVACCINKAGVLILSPFAGAGESMHEALMVNPYEINNVVEVLDRALSMPSDEKEMRMNCLRARERVQDVNLWFRRFLKNIGMIIEGDGEDVLPTQMHPVSMEDFDTYLAPYVGDKAVLSLLLDYDGTLTPLCEHPDLATIPVETKQVLQRLANHPDVFIALVSGRSVTNLKEMVGIEGITYAGNHGMEIVHNDGTRFLHPLPEKYQSKLRELQVELTKQCCQDGAWIEDKGFILTYHYRKVPNDKREELVVKANKLIRDSGFKLGIAHCALEIMLPDVMWDKGRAAIYILRTAFGLDWSERIRIIFVGDDVTDENAIKALKGMAFTFRVVNGQTVKSNADRRLPSTDSVVTLLKWVEKHLATRKPALSTDRSNK